MTDESRRAADLDLRRRFVERVIATQEEERRRLSRELHDEVGQALTSVLVRVAALEETLDGNPAAATIAEDVRGIAERALEEVRRIARGLRPTMLDDLGLAVAVERFAADYARIQGLQVDVRASGIDGPSRLPGPVEIALFRIVQECLTNAGKHARAHRVSILIARENGAVRLIVEDDGVGLMESGEHRTFHGVGIQGIEERVALLRGSVTFESSRRAGTAVYVTIPLEPEHRYYWLRLDGTDVPLACGTITIGRSGDCDVVLAEGTVSRKHARVRIGPASASVEDLGSSHGVSVNGVRIGGPLALEDGDRIQIGDRELVLLSSREPDDSPTRRTTTQHPRPAQGNDRRAQGVQNSPCMTESNPDPSGLTSPKMKNVP